MSGAHILAHAPHFGAAAVVGAAVGFFAWMPVCQTKPVLLGSPETTCRHRWGPTIHVERTAGVMIAPDTAETAIPGAIVGMLVGAGLTFVVVGSEGSKTEA